MSIKIVMNKLIKHIHFITVLICVLLFVYFVLQIINLLAFWIDEAAVALVIESKSIILLKKAYLDIHPLFYIVCLKIWSLIFGMHELSLRGFSFAYGIFTIILLFLFGKRILKSDKIAVFSCFLGATNYMMIWFSTQTRPYSMAAFFSLLSFYFFIRFISGTKRIDMFAYILITVLSLYVHILMVLIFFTQFLSLIILLILKKVNINKFMLPVVLISILGFPAIVISIIQNKMFGESLWINKMGLTVISQSLSSISYGNSIFYILIIILPVSGYILSKYSHFSNLRNQYIKPDLSKYLKKITGNNLIIRLSLISYLLIPVLTLIAISIIRPIYVPGRSEMIFLPAIILWIAIFLSKIKSNLIVILIMLLVTFSTYNSVYAKRTEILSYKSTDKEIMKGIIQRAEKNDTVIATDLSFATMKYYSSYLDPDNTKNITYTSYPSEMQIHPGYKKKYDTENEKIQLEKEAQNLVLLAKEKYSKHIFILYNSNNLIDEILINKFISDNYKLTAENPPVPREPSWFDKILILEKK